jgi:hypothetical protein
LPTIVLVVVLVLVLEKARGVMEWRSVGKEIQAS